MRMNRNSSLAGLLKGTRSLRDRSSDEFFRSQKNKPFARRSQCRSSSHNGNSSSNNQRQLPSTTAHNTKDNSSNSNKKQVGKKETNPYSPANVKLARARLPCFGALTT